MHLQGKKRANWHYKFVIFSPGDRSFSLRKENHLLIVWAILLKRLQAWLFFLLLFFKSFYDLAIFSIFKYKVYSTKFYLKTKSQN